MKIASIGIGQAGGKIVERLIQHFDQFDSQVIPEKLVINTAEADLAGLNTIDTTDKLLIGKSRVNGHGVGADNELGAEVASEESSVILDKISAMDSHNIDAFVLIGALGGGTGSGGLPVIAREMQSIFEKPIYGLGIFPSSSEGSIYNLNAARSFQKAVEFVDNLIVFDNDGWKQSGESVQTGYESMNDELINRISVLLQAGEAIDASSVGQSVVDSSEIINTLDSSGITSIGYASSEVETTSTGLLSRFKKSKQDHTESDNVNQITSLVRKAAFSQLTLKCNITSTEKALIILAGPPEKLSRKGIEKGQVWLEGETETMEIRSGDYPIPNANKVACVVVFSGVSDSTRIKELQKIAVETQNNLDEIANESTDNLESMIDTDDELDSLF